MFTGLVQAMGMVREAGPRLRIESPWNGVIGESIAVNGTCLTVVASDDGLSFDIGPETQARTNLGGLRPGDAVNLERALKLGDPLGGHLVTGHVDAVGRLETRTRREDAEIVEFSCPESLDDLLVHRGSICVDGVSLTLVDVERGRFRVMLIPHTLANTTLGRLALGAPVNLETDLIAKHVKKLFANLTIEI